MMTIGIAGLGRMGRNMAVRLVRGGIGVVGYDRSTASVRDVESHGAQGVETLQGPATGAATP